MPFTSGRSHFSELTDPAQFSAAALAELATHSDPLGHLSLYCDADPTIQSAGTPAWDIGVRNRLRELRSNLEAAGDDVTARAVGEALETHSDEVTRFLAPRSAGVGRVLFLGLSTGVTASIALRIPVGERVVLGRESFIRPLLGALDHGRPAGVVRIAKELVIVQQWRMGALEDVAEYRFDPETSDWRMGEGPATARNTGTQSSASHVERFARRIADHRGRFLDAIGAEIADTSNEREWRVCLIYGDPRLSTPVADALTAQGQRVISRDALLENAPADRLIALVDEHLGAQESADEAELCTSLADSAAAGATAVMGLSQTLGALNEARVAHLVIDQSARWDGLVSADGRLFAAGVDPAGLGPDDLVADTRMGERMIRAALAQGARVTVVEDAPALLGNEEGVAATTRW